MPAPGIWFRRPGPMGPAPAAASAAMPPRRFQSRSWNRMDVMCVPPSASGFRDRSGPEPRDRLQREETRIPCRGTCPRDGAGPATAVPSSRGAWPRTAAWTVPWTSRHRWFGQASPGARSRRVLCADAAARWLVRPIDRRAPLGATLPIRPRTQGMPDRHALGPARTQSPWPARTQSPWPALDPRTTFLPNALQRATKRAATLQRRSC